MMHVPDRAALACHTAEATDRRWLWFDRSQPEHRQPMEPATTCRAFSSTAERQRINGTACEGCARIPPSAALSQAHEGRRLISDKRSGFFAGLTFYPFPLVGANFFAGWSEEKLKWHFIGVLVTGFAMVLMVPVTALVIWLLS